MEDLLNIVNKLQIVFTSTESEGFDLPQIVVIGSQSSGKSSVLEKIIGKSFIPKGTGIVTRCPLVLQLQRLSEKEKKNTMFAKFSHVHGKTFDDYNEIVKEIEDRTNKLAGENKNICKTPIVLQLFSSSLPNLTLVDLPGLTQVPVLDQPADIPNQLTYLTCEYIENPKSIILVVIPANADMATSESLKLARVVDPDGTRTIAVVTKIDLMDKGTNAMSILKGGVIPVKLGIVGVVNRSQLDVQNKKSVEESLKEEAEYFKQHYGEIANLHGTPYLIKTLQLVLIKHIKSCITSIKRDILEKQQTKTAKLRGIDECDLDKSTIMLDILKNFSNTFSSIIKGNVLCIQTKEHYGGGQIKDEFDKFCTTLDTFDSVENLKKDEVSVAIHNASGINTPVFIPEAAFEMFVKTQIERFRIPSMQCVDGVFKVLIKITQDCIEDPNLSLSRYPELVKKLEGVVRNLLKSLLPTTNERVQDLINTQISYINSGHPDFQKCLSKLNINNNDNTVSENDVPSQENHKVNLVFGDGSKKNQNRDYILMKKLVKGYFKITRVTIQDMVPKIVVHFMVNNIQENLMSELVKTFYSGDLDELLQESKDIVEERRKLKLEVEALEEASDILISIQ